MIEKLNEAYEEMKRVDHLVYVSLKYTRTVDVIINILNRMIDAYALIVDSLIMYATQQGKIIQEPESAIERAQLVKQLYGDDDSVVDNMELYLLLRKLLRTKNVERENEYRRHVTMKTIIEGREEIVNIDIITNYYLYQREFLMHARGIIEGKAVATPRQQEISQPATPEWMTNKQEEVIEEPQKNVSRMVPNQPPRNRPPSPSGKKRAPRPKKYKIQIPTGKNPILRPPYMRFEKKPEPVPVKKAPEKKAEKKIVKKTVKKQKNPAKKAIKTKKKR